MAVIEYDKLRELVDKKFKFEEYEDGLEMSKTLALSFGINQEFIVHDINIDMRKKHIRVKTNNGYDVIFEFNNCNSLIKMIITERI